MEIKSVTGTKRNRGKIKPITKTEIEEAQKNTISNMSAARYLNVTYARYKQYAKLYGLFEQHLNPTGIGTDKGTSKRATSTPLRDVLAGKHPHYSLPRLKNRLIARRKLEEKCYLCGFNERRITDSKIPLVINFIDNNRYNFNLTNLNLLCYNCSFLTNGAPSVAYSERIDGLFTSKAKLIKNKSIPVTEQDYYDSEDADIWSAELSQEEKDKLLAEISSE